LATHSTSGSTFTFNQVANRRIYLFADGSCKTSGVYLPITVNAKPSASCVRTNTSCGQNNGTIVFSSATGGIPPNYEYSLDGVNYQSSPNFSNLPSGNYMARVRTPGSACTQSYSRTISSSNELTATITPGSTICQGESVTLTVSGGNTYAWYDGPNMIGTNATLTVSPGASAQYSCVVSDGTCEVVVSSNIVVNMCGVGIVENSINAAVYPNPTSGNLYIDVAKSYQYVLLDARGREVLKGKPQGLAILNIASYSAGVYTLRITVGQISGIYRVVKE
jgi:hypothetical protein